MNKTLIAIVITIALIVSGIMLTPYFAEQTAIAGSTKKVHFTKTVTSTQDPGINHEGYQLALILSPNDNTLYDGSLTYTASKPVQLVVLHKIFPEDQKGQPTWTVDGENIYGISVINPNISESSGSLEFTGSALGLRSKGLHEFSATVSVDGWVRGQATNIVIQKIEVQREEPHFELSRSHVPVTIPLHKGIYNEKELYYIITDASDKEYAEIITQKQNWQVQLSLPLSNVTKDVLGKIYIFKNGLHGDGIYGYQDEVFSSTPQQIEEYNTLRYVTDISWKVGQKPQVLDTEEKILQAKNQGRIEFEEKKNVILNTPQIIWPEGKMPVNKNRTISNDMEYTGEQIVNVDIDEMTVTFVAHRGWGPNGQTIYYIITDATPKGTADMMGVVNVPFSSSFVKSSFVSDQFQFVNGIKGSGPLGFQPIITDAVPGDSDNYSPFWRVYLVEWVDPKDAIILENKADIDVLKSQDAIIVSIARPMNADYIINSPIIDDPLQN